MRIFQETTGKRWREVATNFDLEKSGMPETRILIVDDSAVIRRVLREALAADAGVEVAGVAGDGESALQQIERLKPDVVTLDVELPGMSGLQILKVIRKRWQRLPVIMFSTLTERGAMTTLEALSLGASDYVTKPGNSGNIEETKEKIREQLLPKIKALCASAARRNVAVNGMPRTGAESGGTSKSGKQKIEVVAMGCSTGGPNALNVMLPKISENLAAPVVLVQHMPAAFTRYLAERLAKICSLRVAEAKSGQVIQSGEVWIAPGDYHLVVRKNGLKTVLQTNQEPPENSCRPAVDVLFRSVAEAFGAHALAVVLTGMGADGQRGAENIVARGGKVIVQDEASSVVWGMPGQVALAGYADGIYPLSEIAAEIEGRVGTVKELERKSMQNQHESGAA